MSAGTSPTNSGSESATTASRSRRLAASSMAIRASRVSTQAVSQVDERPDTDAGSEKWEVSPSPMTALPHIVLVNSRGDVRRSSKNPPPLGRNCVGDCSLLLSSQRCWWRPRAADRVRAELWHLGCRPANQRRPRCTKRRRRIASRVRSRFPPAAPSSWSKCSGDRPAAGGAADRALCRRPRARRRTIAAECRDKDLRRGSGGTSKPALAGLPDTRTVSEALLDD